MTSRASKRLGAARGWSSVHFLHMPATSNFTTTSAARIDSHDIMYMTWQS